MLEKKRILFTGGGTTGHVAVNLALIPQFKKDGWNILYLGSKNGIEKQLISQINKVEYKSISTGKLRRYFDWKNFSDIARILIGIFQAYSEIKKYKPDVLFSKGGFVSFPVVLGGWLNGVPIILHESDVTPGLANRLAMPFVSKICTTFPETSQIIKSSKVKYIGPIIRDTLKNGDPDRGINYCRFNHEKPILLIMGGSSGSKNINLFVRNNLDELLSKFQVLHICGKGNRDKAINTRGYIQFEYLDEQLADIIAMSDIVISRAGANSIFELLYLQKPTILVPLSRKASRGDQIINAESFRNSGYCEMVFEEDLHKIDTLNIIYSVYKNKEFYVENMKKSDIKNGIKNLYNLIIEIVD